MRSAFAHEAVVGMDPDSDTQALGAAVTVALCGHWEHEPPCPIAPHYSSAERLGRDVVRLRVLFATEPELEATVRGSIDSALSRGQFGQRDQVTGWQLHSTTVVPVDEAELEHARRLAAS
jgi:hypothetical protein